MPAGRGLTVTPAKTEGQTCQCMGSSVCLSNVVLVLVAALIDVIAVLRRSPLHGQRSQRHGLRLGERHLHGAPSGKHMLWCALPWLYCCVTDYHPLEHCGLSL